MSPPDPRSDLTAGERIICALDLPALDEALGLVDRLEGSVHWFKIGMELFTREGPRAVEAVLERGAGVFLDLKYHDIPATAERAVEAAGAIAPPHRIAAPAYGGPSRSLSPPRPREAEHRAWSEIPPERSVSDRESPSRSEMSRRRGGRGHLPAHIALAPGGRRSPGGSDRCLHHWGRATIRRGVGSAPAGIRPGRTDRRR